MIITLFQTDDVLQFNLSPENDHERQMVKGLEGYSGPATIHPGVSIGECRGGYLRDFGSDKSICAVTIHKAPPDVAEAGEPVNVRE